jgi:hypothetical protein
MNDADDMMAYVWQSESAHDLVTRVTRLMQGSNSCENRVSSCGIRYQAWVEHAQGVQTLTGQ